jgi:hypothetical protein
VRRNDWPERLADTVAAAEAKAFSDTYYCAVFAADCVLAMTDVDPLGELRGLTQAEAEAAIAPLTLRDKLVSLYGEPVHVAFAHRGDVVVRDNDGQLAVGICLGQQSAFATDVGLAHYPTLEQIEAFRV